MGQQKLEIKFTFITGLRPVVADELQKQGFPRFTVGNSDSVYLDFVFDLEQILQLRSVTRAFLVVRGSKYHPRYVEHHKSILGDMIAIVINGNRQQFKTFKLTCAGSDSLSARAIAGYVRETFGLTEDDDADLKLHMIKTGGFWEIGVQMTPRPLSSREYRVRNMGGAMDATIAYSVNTLCNLDNAKSYLNVFSGSATLLIEAAQCYPNLKRLIGFDYDKSTLSLAIQNIRKAGVIRRVQLKEADIFDDPDFGTFDAITSDLPFGMAISKYEDLETLYRCFAQYCKRFLHPKGRLVVYSSEHTLLRKAVSESKFKIVNTIELQFYTSAKTYLRPKIFVCEFA